MGEWSIEPAKWQADISPLANEALWGGLSQAPPWGMPDETLRGGCPVPSLKRGQIPPLSPRACPFLEPLHSLFARDRVAHAPGCPRRRDRILNHCGYVDPARRIGHILLAAGEHLLAPLVLLPDHLVRLAANDMRTRRDATLEMPVLMLPSVQINIRAGDLPPVESNGVAYLKIPLNAL